MDTFHDTREKLKEMARTKVYDGLSELLKPYEEHIQATIGRLAGQRIGGQIRASDITQESYVDILQELGKVSEERPLPDWPTEAAFRGWLSKVVWHNTIDALRDPSIKRRISKEAQRDEDGMADDLWPNREARTPSTIVSNAEIRNRLVDLLWQTLPDRQAAAVQMRYLQGLPIPDIQKNLGHVSYDAAASLVHNGLRTIREHLTGELEAMFSSLCGDSLPESRAVVEGRLKSVDVTQSRVGVKYGETESSFTVASNAVVTLDGQPATLDELLLESSVGLLANGKVAKEIHATTHWRGVIREITGTEMILQTGTSQEIFHLADDSTIALDGEPAAIATLQTRMTVVVSVRPSSGLVIEAESAKPPTRES